MWFVTDNKYKKVFDENEECKHNNIKLSISYRDVQIKLLEAQKRLQSTERHKVLADLEEALTLIAGYQHALTVLCAADPQVLKADALLERWEVILPSRYLHSSLKEEEDKWGNEAYGKITLGIESEVIDEGDKKEPGYTRARIRVVDKTIPEPEELKVAHESTEEAEPSDLKTPPVTAVEKIEYIHGD